MDAQDTEQAQMARMGVCRLSRRVVLERWVKDLEALAEIEVVAGGKWSENGKNRGGLWRC